MARARLLGRVVAQRNFASTGPGAIPPEPPEWVPEGAVYYIDGINGRYFGGGVEKTLSQMMYAPVAYGGSDPPIARGQVGGFDGIIDMNGAITRNLLGNLITNGATIITDFAYITNTINLRTGFRDAAANASLEPRLRNVTSFSVTDADTGYTNATPVASVGNHKFAFAAKNGDKWAAYLDGVEIRTETGQGSTAAALVDLYLILTTGGASRYLIRTVTIYEGVKSGAELTALTTLPTIALSASSIAENNAINDVIGALSVNNPDTDATYTYTLVSGTGSTDNASFNISGSNLRASAAFDYETKSSYSCRLRATDQFGRWFEKVQAITVTDVAETSLTFLGLFGIATDSGAPPSYFRPFTGMSVASSGGKLWLASGSTSNGRTFVAAKVHVPSLALDAAGTAMTIVNDYAGGTNSHGAYFGLNVTWSGAFEVSIEVSHIENACGIALWHAKGYNATPVDHDGVQMVGATPRTLDTVNGGKILGYGFGRNNGNNPAHSFTNAIERDDQIIESQIGHAAADGDTTGSSTTITCTLAGANLYNVFVALSLQPA